jgi:hypothetical protein
MAIPRGNRRDAGWSVVGVAGGCAIEVDTDKNLDLRVHRVRENVSSYC